MPMSTLRRLAAMAVALAAVASVAACGGADPKPSAGASTADLGLARPGIISAAVTAGGIPFTSVDAGGKPVGMLIDLNNIIAQKLGVKIEYKVTDLDGGMAGMTSGQYDMLSIGMVQSPERAKNVSFTTPFYWGQNTILTLKDKTESSTADFAGKRVGASRGSTQWDYAQKALTSAKLIAEPTNAAGISQLLNGNLEGFVIGSTSASQILPQNHGKIKIAAMDPQDSPASMAVNKKEPAFLKAYNEAFTAVVDDGTFLKLYYKYLPGFEYPTQMYKYWPQIQKQVEGGATPPPVSGS